MRTSVEAKGSHSVIVSLLVVTINSQEPKVALQPRAEQGRSGAVTWVFLLPKAAVCLMVALSGFGAG